ncbi:MOSC domain-containing protein [Streptomyces meridianus]|uniref:MOSC domain-containing protein n=1 Tax=Streptomyces meridianus TaxID=2938945 RepID=A0ABT0XB88_9ACTN|nr:MOSC N-terminal beta barrel domain-containing protein [Streptomyces meridianus]MCM2579777.1 MOSC domain-containing protein [Streptomyces meridianus]
MSTPVLRAIHVHPVKSLAGYAPGEAAVEPWGLAGDRRWMLIDGDGRFVTQRLYPRLALCSAEPLPGGGLRLSGPGGRTLDVPLPQSGETAEVTVFDDRVTAALAGPEPAAWFSDHLGADVRLVHLDAPDRARPLAPGHGGEGATVSFADAFPLLVTTASSLDALNSLIAQGDDADEGPLPMDRFRPNVVVEGTAPWSEDTWRRIAIGGVPFRVAGPCGRCVITTTDQRTAERGKEPLRTLARHRRMDDRLVFGQNLVPERPGTVRVGDPVEILEHGPAAP